MCQKWRIISQKPQLQKVSVYMCTKSYYNIASAWWWRWWCSESDTSVFNSRPLCHETPFQTSFLLYSFPLHSSMVGYLVSRSHSQWVDHHASKRFYPFIQHQEAISCTIFGEVYSWTGTTTYNPVGLHTLTPCSEPYMPSLTVLRMECGSFTNSHTPKISWQKTLRWRWGVIMTELRR